MPQAGKTATMFSQCPASDGPAFSSLVPQRLRLLDDKGALQRTYSGRPADTLTLAWTRYTGELVPQEAGLWKSSPIIGPKHASPSSKTFRARPFLSRRAHQEFHLQMARCSAQIHRLQCLITTRIRPQSGPEISRCDSLPAATNFSSFLSLFYHPIRFDPRTFSPFLGDQAAIVAIAIAIAIAIIATTARRFLAYTVTPRLHALL
ncbi:hypothetical protein F4678DRAFT_483990 [Xylaria arbuscula]|nr:hypothetical protein F4678DRAFT_483990 [Xylaria arbuscula]